MGEGE
jgi:hypothetical protein